MKMSEARAAAFAAYAVKAAQAADATDPSAAAEERDWQRQRLPEHLRPVEFIF